MNYLGSNYFARENLFTDCRHPYNNIRIFLLRELINQHEAQTLMVKTENTMFLFPLFLKAISKLCCH